MKYNFHYSIDVKTDSVAILAAVDGFVQSLKDKKSLPKDVRCDVLANYAIIDEEKKD